MNEEQRKKIFAAVCFVALMQNLQDKHPSYLYEKIGMLNYGWDAFGLLDIHNKRKVMNWAQEWKFELPDIIQENYIAEERAGEELGLI